jgi:hypothetical protein
VFQSRSWGLVRPLRERPQSPLCWLLVVESGRFGETFGRYKWEPHVPWGWESEVETDLGVAV